MDDFSVSLDDDIEPVFADHDREIVASTTLAASYVVGGRRMRVSIRWSTFFSVLLQKYAVIWFQYVAAAVIAALIANGIFRIPLWQIVDVTLSIFLVTMGLQAAWNVARLLGDLLSGETLLAVVHAALVFMFAFLPFGVIAGYLIYGALSGEKVAGVSFVYDGFLALFGQLYAKFAGIAGDVLGVMSESAAAKGGGAGNVNLASLSQIAQIVGGFAAAVGVYLAWRRGRRNDAEAHRPVTADRR